MFHLESSKIVEIAVILDAGTFAFGRDAAVKDTLAYSPQPTGGVSFGMHHHWCSCNT